MPLLNYTTSVEAAKTVNEIQEILRRHGARTVLTNYDKAGIIESLSFQVDTPSGVLGIRLPVNVSAIEIVLNKQWRAGKLPRRFLNHEQAIRIAWRILKDWVEAQMAILETEMVKMEQIFLPYMVVKDNKTLFQVMEERQYLLTPGKEEEGKHV